MSLHFVCLVAINCLPYSTRVNYGELGFESLEEHQEIPAGGDSDNAY